MLSFFFNLFFISFFPLGAYCCVTVFASGSEFVAVFIYLVKIPNRVFWLLAHIGYNGLLFSHEYSGEGRGAYHQGRHLSTDILITAYSSVVTVAEWLDGSFESQNRL